MKYTNILTTISRTNSQAVNDGRPALGHVFRNMGNTTAYINDWPLYPGEILTLDAPGGSIDTTLYYVRFDNAGTTSLVLVFSKSVN